MEAAVQALLRDFFHEANVPAVGNDIDLPLQRLVDDVRADSAVCKRDLRRLLEKDPSGFVQAACRILKVSTEETGAAPLLELLWSSPLLLSSLIDPSMLSLPTATALARRWVAFDPMLDIKLLQIAFPLGEDEAAWAADGVRSQRALEIVSELPPNRHILLALAKLLRNSDPYTRSKAALLYARVAANALVGLHYCGEAGATVTDVLQNMVHSSEPKARAAAAFVMGRILDASCTPILENLLRDGDQQVRSQALRALIRIRRQDRAEGAREAEPVAACVAGAEQNSPDENAPPAVAPISPPDDATEAAPVLESA